MASKTFPTGTKVTDMIKKQQITVRKSMLKIKTALSSRTRQLFTYLNILYIISNMNSWELIKKP